VDDGAARPRAAGREPGTCFFRGAPEKRSDLV